MKITNTFCTRNGSERLTKQSELHHRCILLIRAAREKKVSS